ncbi:MAG: DUF4340 domain-containing protein [Treponema sp.]|nr:DUF4340 domain-containing protein [Treponema sp.]
MTYKKQFAVLSTVIAALALIYVLTIVFDPQRIGSRSDAYSWLDPKQKDKIDRLTITNQYETVMLERRGSDWFVSRGGRDFPARRMRVEDFIDALCKRAPYPMRSSSPSSHQRLSLTAESSTQVVAAGGAGLPLLHLLIGQGDVTGRNVYLRKQGQNEVRSGEDIFSAYTESETASWYNLRLFPETESGRLEAASVQRLTVYPPDEYGEGTPFIFSRRGREWTFTGVELESLDMGRVDNYIRDILNTSGDDFEETVSPSDPAFNDGRIVMELGDGGIRTLRTGYPDQDGKRLAIISGTNMVYSLPAWTSSRLFPDPYTFEED